MQSCHSAVFEHSEQMRSCHSAVFKHSGQTQSCHGAGSSKRVVSEGELLTSTWEHRLITGGSMLLMFALFGKGLSEISTPTEAMAGVAAFLFAYGLSGKPL